MIAHILFNPTCYISSNLSNSFLFNSLIYVYIKSKYFLIYINKN